VLEHPGNIVRVVLEIGVHGHHQPAAHGLEAGVGGRRLPRIGLEPHQPHPRVGLAEAADDLGAPVPATIVHEDDLVAEAGGRQHLADLRPEER
jgi:hypothetical protein